MHRKKTGLAKSLLAPFKRFFRARSIIIISNHKVDHLPLSGVMQVLLVVGILGLFSGISYITGSYMAASSTIRDKERKLASTTVEKVRISEEMDALRHDLTRLSQNGDELSAYTKSILDEHASLDLAKFSPVASAAPLVGQDADGLTSHVAFLEGRIKDIEDENDHLVMAIRTRTDKKIDTFEDIISSTGLDADKLERMASTAAAKPGAGINNNDSDSDDSASGDGPDSQHSAADHASASPVGDAEKKDAHAHDDENQGGPFIPLDSASLNDTDRELVANVDRMMVLHDIVEQLPLSRPIASAVLTGPFGKRIDPFNGRWAIHPGLDMAGPVGSKIFATSNGRVITAAHRPAYGNMVDIDHGFGIVTRYAHMSKILVSKGDMVKKGQQVGVEGSTGRSTGPHLHYEVRINDRPVNPVKFLDAGEYVSEGE